MLVETHTIEVTVRIAADHPDNIEAALADIKREVYRVARRKVLWKRYSLKLLTAYNPIINRWSS